MFNNENRIFNIASEKEFLELSLSIFNYQASQNAVYRQWIQLLNIDPAKVSMLEQIPFLPIEFFKKQEISTSPLTQNTVKFTSSSTTSQTPSTHFVTDISVYEKSFLKGFELFYGKPSDYCILALLPNYLQRSGSSLVYMCDKLIKESQHTLSGFFLDEIDKLITIIEELKKTKQKIILIGVSYALMDLCDKAVHLNENFIVMETGGMKGTRKELLKSELHTYLRSGFKINNIHSEYGMTELLSQAYSLGNEEFASPPWLKFLIREVDDPLKIRTDHKTGGVNVIDLANVNSCSFIATKDLGKINENGKLELMGRYDNSDVRGCNLMFGNL
ncbi:MAG: acyl transferase [Bacteroidetes bacterium]|nr:acyl transferase [Bacteroidota bacterium]